MHRWPFDRGSRDPSPSSSFSSLSVAQASSSPVFNTASALWIALAENTMFLLKESVWRVKEAEDGPLLDHRVILWPRKFDREEFPSLPPSFLFCATEVHFSCNACDLVRPEVFWIRLPGEERTRSDRSRPSFHCSIKFTSSQPPPLPSLFPTPALVSFQGSLLLLRVPSVYRIAAIQHRPFLHPPTTTPAQSRRQS